MTDKQNQNDDFDENIKLPRGPIFAGISKIHLMRTLMFGALLVGVLFMRKPCSQSAGMFIESFDPQNEPQPLDPLEGVELIPAEEALKNWPKDN